VPEHDSNIFSKFEWGSKELAGGIFKDNVFGVQFHPEKSARAGLRFLEKFMSL
jgi:glutamine amidotransferase